MVEGGGVGTVLHLIFPRSYCGCSDLVIFIEKGIPKRCFLGVPTSVVSSAASFKTVGVTTSVAGLDIFIEPKFSSSSLESPDPSNS